MPKFSFRSLVVFCSIASLFLLSIRSSRSEASVRSPEKPPARRYLISVDTALEQNRNASWSKGLCAFVHATLSDLSVSEPASKCVSFAADRDAENAVKVFSMFGNFEYRIHLAENSDGSLDMQVMNWRRDRTDSDFEKVGWKVAPDSPALQADLVRKLLRRLVEFDLNERMLKEAALISGMQESKTVRIDADGTYRDAESSKELSFDEAFARFERESSRTRNFLRATSEIGVMLGVGAVFYYKGHVMGAEEDADVPGSWAHTIKTKLTDSSKIRFDSNDVTMNAGHAFAGALYYHAARTGGFSSLESFLMAFVSSTLWEYLSEFHEKVSINDEIITPVGGAAIGETLYQFGDFFLRGGDTLPNRILTGIFGSLQKFDLWMDGQKLPRAKNLDRYGFNADLMHEFDVWAGVSSMSSKGTNAGTGANLGWDMVIIKAPGYGKQGKGQAGLKDTVMSQFMLNMVYGKNGVQEFEALMKSVFAGYFLQNIQKNSADQLDGYSFLVGASSAFDSRSLPTRADLASDWHAVVDVLGATVDVVAYRNGTKLRLTMDVYADFAMVRSLAYDDYADAGNSKEGLKEILTRYGNGYYYGIGTTTAGTLSISRGNWELGVEGKYRSWDSVEGLDRFQEQVTKDFDQQDTIASGKVKFSHPFFFRNARLTHSAERITHGSRMGDVSRKQRYNQVMSRLVFTF